jgi:hypothetical protein
MKTMRVKPVFVDTTDKSSVIVLDDNSNRLVLTKPFEAAWGHKEIILISLDGNVKINVKDKIYHVGRNQIFTVSHFVENGLTKTIICEDMFGLPNDNLRFIVSDCAKVIATHDQLSPEYIERFIEEFNNGNVKDIEIKGELLALHGKTLLPCSPSNNESNSDMSIYKFHPKLVNGFVDIVEEKSDFYNGWLNLSDEDKEVIFPKRNNQEEKTYTYDEMCRNMQKYLNEYVYSGGKYITPMKWLKNNTK